MNTHSGTESELSIFLSHPKPHTQVQEAFARGVQEYIKTRGLIPRTLGVTDYDMEAPLSGIRRLMLKCSGLICIALRRTLVHNAICKSGTDLPGHRIRIIRDAWLTSPFCHIEPAMAFQLDLPVLILREKGVLQEGIVENGVVGLYVPEFDLYDPTSDYLETREWTSIAAQWEELVRAKALMNPRD